MRIALSSDERAPLVEAILRWLADQGHTVQYLGPEAKGEERDWPLVTRAAAVAVTRKKTDASIVCCYTGTGASIAANKVPGIRAALCGDAETARGARKWNHANVLALSIRATSEPMVREILTAWFAEPWSTDDWNRQQIERLTAMEQRNE